MPNDELREMAVSNVLEMPKREPVLKQRDIAECRFLEKQASEAREAYECKRRFIIEQLRDGAVAEEGIREACLKKYTRNGKQFERLLIRW